ncbi:MAG: metallophosphoesterase [Myxococcota bacterium]|nr:metallophosphoesterase [Myxococcota bacterium]
MTRPDDANGHRFTGVSIWWMCHFKITTLGWASAGSSVSWGSVLVQPRDLGPIVRHALMGLFLLTSRARIHQMIGVLIGVAIGCSSDHHSMRSNVFEVRPGGAAASIETANDAGVFRAVFLADTHLIGPQYSCCQESPGIDNDSIMKTVKRLERTRATINAMVPKPDMVFVLGDVVHAAHHGRDLSWYTENESAFSVARDLFNQFEMPVHFVFGNHDYEVDCDSAESSFTLTLTHSIFDHFFDAQPYEMVDHKGWRFLLTNGQLGETWRLGDPKCDTFYASYGREQLAWIDQALRAERPTFVLSHYMRLVTQTDEYPDGPHRDLFSVLDGRPNVKAVLVGHTHRWIDLTAINGDVPHHVVAATRYDADNFWTVEFAENGDTFRILDFEKRLDLSSCALPWRYDGVPMSIGDRPETGDCVVGLEE